MASARVDRDEWRRRVAGWKASGLTAKEFAAEIGINAGTLQFWQHKLKAADRLAKGPRARRASTAILSSIVEVRSAASSPTADSRFEIELGNGRRVRVAPDFNADALMKLLSALEAS